MNSGSLRGRLAALSLLLSFTLHAGGLKKVWTVKLDAAGSTLRSGVFSVRFSPDGTRLLLLTGSSWKEQQLVQADVRTPDQPPTPIRVNPGTEGEDWAWGASPAIRFSATGRHAVVGEHIVDTSFGTSCILPKADYPGYFFVTSNQVEGIGRHTLFRYSVDCQLVSQSAVSANVVLLAADPVTNRVGRLESAGGFFPVLKVRVTDSTTDQTLFETSGTRGAAFASNGQTLCRAFGPDWHQAIECSGPAGYAKSPTVTGAITLRTGSQSQRVVISEWGRIIDFIEWRWAAGKLRRRVIGDFGSNKMVASWHPGSQMLVVQSRPYGPSAHPKPFDISPDGQFLVEAGDGKVTLYQISAR